jgi:hypothetical protein
VLRWCKRHFSFLKSLQGVTSLNIASFDKHSQPDVQLLTLFLWIMFQILPNLEWLIIIL